MLKIAGLTAALALGAAGSANAAVITTTFAGVITAQSDPLGLFASADIVGYSYSLVFTSDDSIMAPTYVNYAGEGDALSLSYINGPNSAVFTAGPYSISTSGAAQGVLQLSTEEDGRDDIAAQSYDPLPNGGTVVYSAEVQPPEGTLPTGAYFTPLSYSVADGEPEHAVFVFSAPPGQSASSYVYDLSITQVDQSYSGTPLPVPPPPPPIIFGVPEPSAWAMMLLGFGGLGLAVRSRRLALDTSG